MDTERLVKMANDIGNFFNAEPDRAAAVEGVADHLHKFWDPRMRQAILAHYREGGIGLSEVSRAAVGRLAREAESTRQTGDG
jgi:formate dehydrogenase subunit delta